ncbi:hypothetical protein KKR91_01270 [Arthrobacter jiangjiafuii]|uniref:DUF7352 domain-containing protein n=1 Tax=Arthrobacter jiangjiafuii TaxID=2817475 RepID=A0A975M630_9MICC|nr:hypothetical protein [Arthrobacter jiangjiafuii]MBP3044862.1 hypothetical protein [Arthrobacter jiangjiafuii]QWC10314.1 hypothetical protein KKR91_01270 [Arthrobacter jiangjiafuii]
MSHQRVYKLAFLPGVTEMGVNLSPSAEVIHFAAQDNNLCLWYIDRDDADGRKPRAFSIRGTGHDIEDTATYIDTAFLGAYVFHLFETTQENN